MNGLTTVNVELTSRCNKSCAMCGRCKMERDHPELCDWGDMEFDLVHEISKQLPSGIGVQFHFNGEPLLYPYLADALTLFQRQIRCLNTNGKLLMEKREDLLHLDTLTISVIQDDPEGAEQYEIAKEFVKWKGDRLPLMVYRMLGWIEPWRLKEWKSLRGIEVYRMLHDPMGSRDYVKPVTKPEIGICLDLLSHMAIDRKGRVSLCVRFDPEGLGIIGNANEDTLEEIWNGYTRQTAIEYHKAGQRNKVAICAKCDYWGVAGG